MTFHRIDHGRHTTLRIEGTLDALTAPRLRTTIEALVAERRLDVTVDLSALRLIDSSGVGAVIALYRRLHGLGGRVTIAGACDQPLALLKLLRLESLFAAER